MKRNKGFTIVELMAVVIILILFSLMSMAAITKITERSRMRAFIKEANVFAKGAVTKYYNDKILDEYSRDDIYNGTVEGKVCYSIPDNLLGKYVVKDQKHKYTGSVEVCYAKDCTYQTKVWFSNGKGYFINGESVFNDESDVEFSQTDDMFNSCGYDTIGSYRGSQTIADFDYTGDEQRLSIVKDGYYRLEAWGAQGGDYTPRNGGFGAYATVEAYLKQGDVVYINVGGKGVSDCKDGCPGGYNGGGSSPAGTASGGGATSIALEKGTIETLAGAPQRYTLLVVASGGGGVTQTSENGSKSGLRILPSDWARAQYSVGKAKANSAGGGGYESVNANWQGAGGVSYIANPKTKNAVIYCYKCIESTDASSRTVSTSDLSVEAKTNTPKIGNGYARLTYLANYQLSYNLDGGSLPNNLTNPSSYGTESETITLNNPVKTNYDFIGWSADENLYSMYSLPSKSEYYIKGDGTEVSHNEFSIFQVNVDPNTYYSIVNSGNYQTPGYAIYDSQGNYLTGSDYNKTSKLYFKTPNNASYIRFSVVTLQSSANFDRRIFKLVKPVLHVTIPTGSTGNKKFTAYYIPTDYQITYDLNGGSISTPNPTSYSVESATINLNNPTKEGYEFIGWTGSNGTTPQTSVSIPKGSSGNKAYTAVFE